MTTDEELAKLARRIRRCKKCKLHETRCKTVPGEGPAPARVMLVGEAPGKSEDEQGRPFIGQAGAYLVELLEGISLTREQVFITSVIKCRPPKNRPPHVGELGACKSSWLDPQIEQVDPEILVLMGQAAIRGVCGETGRMTDLHGQTREADGRTCLFTYHPAAGMRFPDLDQKIRSDFQRLAELLES